MKKQDIDRLKALCDKEGFEVSRFWEDGPLFQISKKKDPWDGVDFFTVKSFDKIYRIDKIEDGLIWSYDGCAFTIDVCDTSTEQEYVDQLKKECFERFGEIKEGQKYIEPNNGCHWVISSTFHSSTEKWTYIKEKDILMHHSLRVYQSGQWATKLPERVDVSIMSMYMNIGEYNVDFKLKNAQEKYTKENEEQIGNFLAKQLEKYLNDEQ